MNPRYLALVVIAAMAGMGCSNEVPLLTPPPSPPEPAVAPAAQAAQPAPTPPPAAPAPAPAPRPERAAAPQAPPGPTIRAAHILVMHRESQRVPPGITRTRDEARTRAEEVLRRVRSGEDFGTLAGTYSDEPGAGPPRGGDLGRFQRGAMVPAFEAAAFALQPGQLSGIVETPFGFHIIRRTE